MGIAKDGYPFILAAFILSSILDYTFPLISLPFWMLTALIVWFFRDPNRTITPNPNHFLSPADGTIQSVNQIDYNGKPYHHIVIFLSVFNVHINRIPCAGTVIATQHKPGLFKAAFDPSIHEKNERMEIDIDTAHGQIRVVQIAGLLARRIVCRLTPNQAVNQGDRFGMIKFSSRTDLYIPADTTTVLVSKKDKVQGGLTVLAKTN
ncbi:MAG: phosphatidylserine decarboxylase [Candidatus Marinamargulisbacteria bacterium]|jgi:phosphatidylserine decarboxylase|nr:phosphatidylserine decarboxylase family protein [bacterium]MDG2264563.1 phosphatidylserine decarboxylase [Candidatus Marinamargulisbacteria bacterium]|tara:strand:+ start:6092 stop:6709 length:618 start_codon:yes stop_codon:yes gene_type:complete